MIPTMHVPLTGWNPGTGNSRTNGVRRQEEIAGNLTGVIPGVPAFGTHGVPLNTPFVPTTPFGVPVTGVPTMTPFGVVPQPTMTPFIGQTPIGVPVTGVPTTTPFGAVPQPAMT
ncbi:MAG: hypothetical protein V3T70_01850, partial [Phycisphaerae bacterium]